MCPVPELNTNAQIVLCCHMNCAHLGAPLHQIVGIICTVPNSQSRYPQFVFGSQTQFFFMPCNGGNGRQDSPCEVQIAHKSNNEVSNHKLLYLGKGDTDFGYISCICSSYNDTFTKLPLSRSVLPESRPFEVTTL